MKIFLVFLLLLFTAGYCYRRKRYFKTSRRQTRSSFNRILSVNQRFQTRRSRNYMKQKYKQPDLLEGDMIYDKRLKTEIQLMKDGIVAFDAANDVEWKKGIVPYKYDMESRWTSREKQIIEGAMKKYHDNTCIRFEKYSPGRTSGGFIEFIRGAGCYSYVGFRGAKGQPVSLGNGCLYEGIIIHELMHALGFFHEQSRTDRDNFIRIVEANIKPGREDQFAKYQPREASTLGLPYDYNSIMHYGRYAFSRNGKATIELTRRAQPGTRIGQRDRLSETDIKQLNIYYDCQKSGTTGGGSGNAKPTPVTTTTTTTTTTERTSVTSTGCKDSSGRCNGYVRYCNTSRWVRYYCPASCGLCCTDRLKSCTSQDCTKSIYRNYLCKKTCKNCGKKG